MAKSDRFVKSVSVSMEQLRSNWRDFHEIWYRRIFRKSVEKIQVSLKPDKNNGSLHEDLLYIYDNISLSSCTFMISCSVLVHLYLAQFLYIYGNISLSSCILMIISCSVLLHLWQYLAQFFYIYDILLSSLSRSVLVHLW